ncbi:MAG: PilT protein domain protein [Chloroflexi bacterium]|nr:PilT protein domain protein [Chloroflexota bacterium]
MAFIEGEDGADRVEDVLRGESVLLPFIVGLEVYYVTMQEQAEEVAASRLALIRQLPAAWLDQVNDDVLLAAGRIKARHRLSLADALVAAFAQENAAILLHKDPEFDAIAALVSLEHLPYK